MLVALLVITYVPALTVVPEEARKSPASVLITTAHQAFEEGRSKKELPLVRWDGTPIQGPDGQPRIHRIADCEPLAQADRDTCKLVFTEVSTCEREQPGDTACVNNAIADHVAREGKTIVVDEVALYNVAKIPVDKDGRPTQDAAGKPLPKAGPPAVMKRADCDAASLSVYEKEACLELFVAASECLIKKPDDTVENCLKKAAGDWVDTNLSPDEDEEEE
jgi:hypothetical protein